MSVFRSHLFPHITYIIALALVCIVGFSKLRSSLNEIRDLDERRNHATDALLAANRAHNKLENLLERHLQERKRVNHLAVELKETKAKIRSTRAEIKKLQEYINSDTKWLRVVFQSGFDPAEIDVESAEISELLKEWEDLNEKRRKKEEEIDEAYAKVTGETLEDRRLRKERERIKNDLVLLQREAVNLCIEANNVLDELRRKKADDYENFYQTYTSDISPEIQTSLESFEHISKLEDPSEAVRSALSALNGRITAVVEGAEVVAETRQNEKRRDPGYQTEHGKIPRLDPVPDEREGDGCDLEALIADFHAFDVIVEDLDYTDRLTSLEALIQPVESKPLSAARGGEGIGIQWYALLRLQELSSLQTIAFRNLKRTTIITFLVLIVLSVTYLYAVNLLLAGPIKSLASVARSVTSGKLRVRAPREAGGPVATLAHDFNRMVDMLVRSLNEQERALAKLRIRTRDLQAANEHKNRFIANISHELKTPLNAIIGFADILLSTHHGELSERQRNYLHRIFKAGDHLLAMICDLIDVMKLDLNALNLKPETFDIREQTEEIVELMRPQVDKKQHQMDVRIDNNLPEANMDLTRYKQILMNLMSNAVKFTPEEGKLDISLRFEDDHFVLKVRDNGIGISKVDQKRIFQDFIQLDSRLHRQHEGTGIGLALTRRLVDLMGGAMNLDSVPEKGSVFTVELPLKYVPIEDEPKKEEGEKKSSREPQPLTRKLNLNKTSDSRRVPKSGKK